MLISTPFVLTLLKYLICSQEREKMKKFLILLLLLMNIAPSFATNNLQIQAEKDQHQQYEKLMQTKEGKQMGRFLFTVLLLSDDYLMGSNADTVYNDINKLKQEKKDPINQKYADKFFNLHKKFIDAYENNLISYDTYKEICKDKIYIEDSEYNQIDKMLLNPIIFLNSVLE